MNVSQLKLNGWYWFSLGFYVQKCKRKKKWFPFCQGTGPKEFVRANPLFQLFQNNKRTKITNEKIKAVWKKPINVVHLDGGDDHPRTRQSTSAHRPIAVGVGVPVFFSLPIRIMATVILGMVLWNVAFTAREIVPQDGRWDRAVLTDHRLNYRPRKEALFLCLWFGLLSESCWDR